MQNRFKGHAEARRLRSRLPALAFLVFAVAALGAYLAFDASGKLSIPVRFAFLGVILTLSYTGARLYLFVRRREDALTAKNVPDNRFHGKADRETDCTAAGASDREGLSRTENVSKETISSETVSYETVMILLFAVSFALYLHLLLTLTLFDASLGRDLVFGENSREYYLEWFCNFHPFDSIWRVYLVGGVKNGLVPLPKVLLNLGGNLVAFMPFAFFLPLFFRAERRFCIFLPTVTLAVAFVEMMQFLSMRGSCDIDDLILNAGGAAIAFFALKIPPVSRLLSVFTCGLWECGEALKKTNHLQPTEH